MKIWIRWNTTSHVVCLLTRNVSAPALPSCSTRWSGSIRCALRLLRWRWHTPRRGTSSVILRLPWALSSSTPLPAVRAAAARSSRKMPWSCWQPTRASAPLCGTMATVSLTTPSAGWSGKYDMKKEDVFYAAMFAIIGIGIGAKLLYIIIKFYWLKIKHSYSLMSFKPQEKG